MKTIVALCLLLSGCNASKEAVQNTLDYSILAQHEIGGYQVASEQIITKATDLEILCKDLKISDDAMAQIDLSQETVVGLFLGEKTTGGYTIVVESVIATEETIQIVYHVNEPKPTDFVTTVMTQPYCVITFSNPENKRVTFLKE